MPELHEISYSHEATIAAVRNYYRFLIRMDLKESYVADPPEGGWPEISLENLSSLGKTNEAILLLRHLPYISSRDDSAQGAAHCLFIDWRRIARSHVLGELSAEDVLVITEGWSGLPESMSPHVVGLTRGSYLNPCFLLDTKLGVVFWEECHSDVKRNPSSAKNTIMALPKRRLTSAVIRLPGLFLIFSSSSRTCFGSCSMFPSARVW